MSDYHAIASPSSAEKWLTCANSLAAELGQPDTAGAAADLGTDKHELLTLCLQFQREASDYIGHTLCRGHKVDWSFSDDVQNVVDNVRARIQNYENLGYRVEMDLEQDVPIDHITGEKGATGRADVVLRVHNGKVGDEYRGWADIIDAKFGYAEVAAEHNVQLMMYAAGVIEKFALTDEINDVNLVIEQPARSKESIEGASISADELLSWVHQVAKPAAEKALLIRAMIGERALRTEDFKVTEKGCQWCKAAAVCPARVAHAEETVGSDFSTLEDGMSHELTTVDLLPVEDLGAKFEALEVIEDWIKAVRARIEFELLAGKSIPGLKLVAGKKGNRQWASDEEAEAMLKKFRVKRDQMYSFKLLGPKPILEVMKGRPRQAKHIEALIVQPAGKPHVALDSDKRPALEIKPVEDGFEAGEEDLC